MPLPQKNTYTIEDIQKLPEGQRAELIDGTLYEMNLGVTVPPTGS